MDLFTHSKTKLVFKSKCIISGNLLFEQIKMWKFTLFRSVRDHAYLIQLVFFSTIKQLTFQVIGLPVTKTWKDRNGTKEIYKVSCLLVTIWFPVLLARSVLLQYQRPCSNTFVNILYCYKFKIYLPNSVLALHKFCRRIQIP